MKEARQWFLFLTVKIEGDVVTVTADGKNGHELYAIFKHGSERDAERHYKKLLKSPKQRLKAFLNHKSDKR